MQKEYPTMTGLEHQLQTNLNSIRERIAKACDRVQRDAADIKLVVVTKQVGVDVVRALCRLGIAEFGENRVQSLCDKHGEIQSFVEAMRVGHDEKPMSHPRWHMIGHLQRNKVKPLIPCVSMVQSVDRLRLAEELNKRGAERSTVLDVLLEVNGGEEPQKSGAAVCAAAHLGEQMESMPYLRLRGLMSMAPQGADEDQLRYVFNRVRELFEEIQHDYEVGKAFDTLSMGMSNDYEIAVECGATMVRVGSAVYDGIELPQDSPS